MRKLVAALLAATALTVALVSSALAVPPHLHCLTTPNGNVHSIARGITFSADPGALENFHGRVHLGVFVNGNHPLSLAADVSAPFTCPPS